jgi:hypothetical protein
MGIEDRVRPSSLSPPLGLARPRLQVDAALENDFDSAPLSLASVNPKFKAIIADKSESQDSRPLSFEHNISLENEPPEVRVFVSPWALPAVEDQSR